MKLQKLLCSCGKTFKQNSYNQAHCVACAYQISVQKGIERARAKRAAAKEKKNHGAA